jgi:hypothetical protein
MGYPKGYYKHSEETKRKIGLANSIALKGKKQSEESNRKRSLSLKGHPMSDKAREALDKTRHKPVSLEQRKKISDTLKGRKLSEYQIKRIRETHTGKIVSKETCEKISNAKMGHPVSLESRKKMSKTKKGIPKSENFRLKCVEDRVKGFWYGNIRYYEKPQYCDLWNENLKVRVRIWYDFRCVECGSMWFPGMDKFHVHHVWYNKRLCCEDTPRSLVLLCESCHMKTHYNHEYWSNHFQDMIDLYYDGRCWLTKNEYNEYTNI